MKIGDKIKALRLTNGNITKEELSNSTGIPESKIAAYERNLSRPPHQILVKIAEHFKVPVEFFFEDEKEEIENSEPLEEESQTSPFEEINLAKMTISTKDKKISIAKDSRFKNKPSQETVAPVKKPKQLKKITPLKVKKESEAIGGIKPINDQNVALIHNDLLGIKTLLNRLIEIVSNKPQLNEIKTIERTKDIILANSLLKKGYVLLELYKDDKGQLGFTLGKR